jgi:adenine phosphoribosyltransferase
MKACADLVRSVGAEVTACAFLIELGFLGGAAKLHPDEIISLIKY